MEYVHAALLLHEGDREITEDNLTAILEAAGIEVDSSRVKALVAALEDVDIEEAVQSPAMAPAAPAAGATAETPAEEEGEAGAETEAEADAEAEEAEEEEDEDEPSGEGLGELFG